MSDKCKLGKVDLSQIECRILNTLAGQWDVVEKFRTGVDIYSELASQFYGFPVDKSKPAERGTGKQLELSAGYGAGGPTIVRTARAGTYGPPVHLSDSQGMQARDLYRGTHPFVVSLWKKADWILWALHDGASIAWPDWPFLTIHDHRIFGPDGTWLDFTSLRRVPMEGQKTIPGRIINESNSEPLTIIPPWKYGWDFSQSVSLSDFANLRGLQAEWQHRVREGWRKTYGARLIEHV